jgi:hypothetical protein
MAVKTRDVVGRRKLRFESHQDVLNDVHALCNGPTRQLGNWSLGEVCQHLAKTVDMSIDGSQMRFPWVLRMIAPLLRKRFLSRPMRAGFTVPKTGAFLLPSAEETAAGLAALEKAVARLGATSQRKPHALFGTLSRQEWDQLHCRHAEMHLSFIVPETNARV